MKLSLPDPEQQLSRFSSPLPAREASLLRPTLSKRVGLSRSRSLSNEDDMMERQMVSKNKCVGKEVARSTKSFGRQGVVNATLVGLQKVWCC